MLRLSGGDAEVTLLVALFFVPLALAELTYLRRISPEIDEQIVIAHILESEDLIVRVLEHQFADAQPVENLNLAQLAIREK